MISHGTNAPPGVTLSEWDLAVKPVKVELLDGNQRSLNVGATGFLFSESGRQAVYLPWHVVTGYGFPDVKVKFPPVRRFLKLITKKVTTTGSSKNIGGENNIIIPLYNRQGMPNWTQEEMYSTNHDLDKIGIYVPKYADIVLINLEIEQKFSEFLTYNRENLHTGSIQNGQEIILTGYPWGYSALGNLTPEPLFIVRHVASWVLKDRPHDFLIDGVGAGGMSGSPILIRSLQGFKLIGVYIGAVFPDVVATGMPKDAYSTLGVGIRFGSRHHFGPNKFPAPDQ